MQLIGKKKLEKLRRKNIGNRSLIRAMNKLINEIEASEWVRKEEVMISRPDADCVHSDGFYFFNLGTYRTLMLIELDEGNATVIWVGNHMEYENTFRNNKQTIRRWLKANEYID